MFGVVFGSMVGSGALYCHQLTPAVGVEVQVRPSLSGEKFHGSQTSPA
jgi:hypothetical protein